MLPDVLSQRFDTHTGWALLITLVHRVPFAHRHLSVMSNRMLCNCAWRPSSLIRSRSRTVVIKTGALGVVAYDYQTGRRRALFAGVSALDDGAYSGAVVIDNICACTTVVLVEHGLNSQRRLCQDEVLVHPAKGLLDSTVVAPAVKPWLIIVAFVSRQQVRH